MNPLIIADNIGPWALRYLSISHRFDNDNFYNNYFSPNLDQAGINIRKQTSNLSSDWNKHNKIFYESAENGNLVWRVKVGNNNTQSIDYIEIWRSLDIVEYYFGDLASTSTWEIDDRKKFSESLFESGFDIKELLPYPLISKNAAVGYYQQFLNKWKLKDNCIINTPWTKTLNP
jgi:hypothetical protein